MLTLTLHPKKSYPDILAAISNLCLRVHIEYSEDNSEPFLKDEYLNVEGSREIIVALEGLEEYKAEWDRFQSDACYVEKDGSTC